MSVKKKSNKGAIGNLTGYVKETFTKKKQELQRGVSGMADYMFETPEDRAMYKYQDQVKQLKSARAKAVVSGVDFGAIAGIEKQNVSRATKIRALEQRIEEQKRQKQQLNLQTKYRTMATYYSFQKSRGGSDKGKKRDSGINLGFVKSAPKKKTGFNSMDFL
jgi:hypothetical protein